MDHHLSPPVQPRTELEVQPRSPVEVLTVCEADHGEAEGDHAHQDLHIVSETTGSKLGVLYWSTPAYGNYKVGS